MFSGEAARALVCGGPVDGADDELRRQSGELTLFGPPRAGKWPASTRFPCGSVDSMNAQPASVMETGASRGTRTGARSRVASNRAHNRFKDLEQVCETCDCSSQRVRGPEHRGARPRSAHST